MMKLKKMYQLKVRPKFKAKLTVLGEDASSEEQNTSTEASQKEANVDDEDKEKHSNQDEDAI